MEIIVKNYEHINSSFPNWNTPKGVYVKSKDHYDRLMKESGMVAYEKVKEIDKRKEYAPSKKALAIIEAAKSSKRKDGKVHLSDRTIDAMKSIGAYGKKEIPSYMQLPQHYQQGGFTK